MCPDDHPAKQPNQNASTAKLVDYLTVRGSKREIGDVAVKNSQHKEQDKWKFHADFEKRLDEKIDNQQASTCTRHSESS